MLSISRSISSLFLEGRTGETRGDDVCLRSVDKIIFWAFVLSVCSSLEEESLMGELKEIGVVLCVPPALPSNVSHSPGGASHSLPSNESHSPGGASPAPPLSTITT